MRGVKGAYTKVIAEGEGRFGQIEGAGVDTRCFEGGTLGEGACGHVLRAEPEC